MKETPQESPQELPYDLAIVGAGPGGYVAAIRASQLGFRTALINKYSKAGGTCLNVGCIPSKALLHSSHLYEQTSKVLASHGIKTSQPSFDLSVMQERKSSVVSSLTEGIAFLLKKNKISYIEGEARLRSTSGGEKILEITNAKNKRDKQQLRAKHIILALGSEPTLLPSAIAEVDEKRILTSTGALSLSSVPSHLAIVGAGVIGLELGSVWSRLGSDVTVIDMLDHIGGLDADFSLEFQKILQAQGFSFKLQTSLVSLQAGKDEIRITTKGCEKGNAGASQKSSSQKTSSEETNSEETNAQETWSASHILLAIGRKAATSNMDLGSCGIDCDERGFITVDESFETSLSGIYAIGDCIGGAMLAHKAEEEGVSVVESLAGNRGHVDYSSIAGVIYTHPEVAVVGLSEREAQARGIEYRLGKFPFRANARARTTGSDAGLVKLLVDASDNRLLGAQILGDEAGTLIQELVAILAYRGTVEDLSQICHPHPSLNESLREAALAAMDRAIHN